MGDPLPMTPSIMKRICEGFSTSRSATHLEICNVKITIEAIEQMHPLFEPHTHLCSLQLRECDLTDDAIVSLCALILASGHRRIRHLDLSGNYLGKQTTNAPRQQYDSSPGTKILVRLLADKFVTLSSVDLSNNPLGNFGILAISQVLPHTSLRELRLSNIHLTPKGFACFVRTLRYASSLCLLDISHNILGYSALMPFFDILPKTELLSINLRDTKMDSIALMALGSSLKDNSTLLTLDISENQVSKESAIVFCNFLKTNTSLQNLTCTNMSLDSLLSFVAFANNSKTGIDDIPIRQVNPLKHDSISSVSTKKYWTKLGFCWTGLLFLALTLIFQIVEDTFDILTIIHFFSNGAVAWGVIGTVFTTLSSIFSFIYHFIASTKKRRKRYWASFLYLILLGQSADTIALIWKTKGNWEEIQEPVKDDDIIHIHTIRTINLIKSITKQIPLMILDGCYLFALNKTTFSAVYLSFFAATLGITWSFTNYLCIVMTKRSKFFVETQEDTIFGKFRTFLYGFLSLSHQILRIMITASRSSWNIVFYIIIAICYYWLFFLISQRVIGNKFFMFIVRSFVLSVLSNCFYGDIVLCSFRGRIEFSKKSRYIPRAVTVVVDVIAFFSRTCIMFVCMIAMQRETTSFRVLLVSIVVFLDFAMIPIRTASEVNGASLIQRKSTETKYRKMNKSKYVYDGQSTSSSGTYDATRSDRVMDFPTHTNISESDSDLRLLLDETTITIQDPETEDDAMEEDFTFNRNEFHI
ncbi:uncharacterized protein MONOS_2764 [Monocercomonoides exilis]|uniref:uncharacterized protein n=1 Tax=Monocercomonoides exilis TaxID=2049356 RepID=UPI00355A5828|nr:hypothetical protein MONOS_2764 [Monocercomonoides exilis]|eukprot:MONOS_2764.1-p1 / transcript=MONOS_2764.1 / gene=MONOS_2764 / organism=Monocercomonoides_exilis_PA203 / gene_product=unspecified product / transcript_product=unspecified product / location=Mono_scaffold00059:38855-41853(-) / protein_length=754 / sequence_SO=supercontig / SO=protein_coding / is_pseudo=false